MKHKLFSAFLAVSVFLCFPQFIISAEPSQGDLLDADFLSSLTFFGESTTTHLRSRSHLNPAQIWSNAMGTACLDSNLSFKPLSDPLDGSSVTPQELAHRERPEYLVLSFGLNGIMEHSKDRAGYLKKYQKLIDAIKEVSPDTRFLIQSVYPVARSEMQTDWNFSVSPQEVNERILLLNQWLCEMCGKLPNTVFVDTSEVLKDKDGFLRDELTTDGIHLNEAAYHLILESLSLYGKSAHESGIKSQ